MKSTLNVLVLVSVVLLSPTFGLYQEASERGWPQGAHSIAAGTLIVLELALFVAITFIANRLTRKAPR